MSQVNYLVRGIPELDDNPIAAHLPLAPLNQSDCENAIFRNLRYHPSERELPPEVRLLKTLRLRTFMEPHPVALDALQSVTTTVVHACTERNPLTPKGRKLMHGFQVELTNKPGITMICGMSGMGKSSIVTAITDYICSFSGQCVEHTTFKGDPVCFKQLTYLRRNLPPRATMSAVCEDLGDTADAALEEHLYGHLFRKISGARHTAFINSTRKIVASHTVNLLVFDEFQNLTFNGASKKEVVQMLVNLRDEMGCPILVVGTPATRTLFDSDPATARRLTEGGCFELVRPVNARDEWFIKLCKHAWMYTWVPEPLGWEDEFVEALYEISQGIPAIMLTALQKAQFHAIKDGLKSVTMDLIHHVYQKQMSSVHDTINTLKGGNYKEILKLDGVLPNVLRQFEQEALSDARRAAPAAVAPAAVASGAVSPNKPKKPTRAKPVLNAEEMDAGLGAEDGRELLNRVGLAL